MKKIIAIILTAALCFSFVLALACNDVKGDKGDKGDPGQGFSETLKIYKMGESVLVYNGNYPMFLLTYNSKTSSEATFTMKSIGFIANTMFNYYPLNSNFEILENYLQFGIVIGIDDEVLFTLDIIPQAKYFYLTQNNIDRLPFAIFEI